MNINDLSILLAAVDIAVKRGAYSILEVGAIGDTAAKLNEFLKAANEQAQAQQAAQESADTPPVQPDAESNTESNG